MSVAAQLFPGIEVIDAHAHLGFWGYPGSAGTLDEFRRLLDVGGFSKVVVSSALAIAYDAVEGNAEVAKAVETDERIYGSIVFNGHYPEEAREEIKRYAEHPRFVAVKFHPAYTGLALNSPENLSILELVARYGLPITFHTWTGDGTAAVDIAKRFPSVPVIWFHSLAADYPKAAELARDLPNVYLEFVTSTQERGKIELLVQGVGAHRMLFGTDQSLFEPIRPLGAVAEAQISEADRRRILGETARKVFKFDHRN
ncbi:MAG: amidohydrolase family protein [Kiritimatiellae bacterium]|nr:amidohydrolase family protein [Kiritimatiellia bacterium]